jgi:hypothetical protein
MPSSITTLSGAHESTPESLYINVTVKDHTAAVKSKVGKKIDKSSLPHPMKVVMHQTAPRIASDLVTTKQMTGQLSKKLVDKIPRKLANKGITAVVSPVFRQGPFVVLKLNVVHVDVLRLINHKDPKKSKTPDRTAQGKERDAEVTIVSPPDVPATLGEAARQFWHALRRERQNAHADLWPKFLTVVWMLLFWLIGPHRRRWIESVALPKVIQRRMVPSLQKMLDLNMERKQLVADGVVLTEAEQCRYFFEHHSELHDAEDGSASPTGLLPVVVLSPALKQASKAVISPVRGSRPFAWREKLALGS